MLRSIYTMIMDTPSTCRGKHGGSSSVDVQLSYRGETILYLLGCSTFSKLQITYAADR